MTSYQSQTHLFSPDCRFVQILMINLALSCSDYGVNPRPHKVDSWNPLRIFPRFQVSCEHHCATWLFYLVFHLCCLMLMPSHDRYFVFSCKGYIRYTHLWRVEKLRPIFERKGLPWWQPCSFWAHQSRWSAVITVMWDNLSCPFQETKDLLPRTLYVSVISSCKNCTLMW